MQKFKRVMRVCGLYVLVTLIVGGYPLTAAVAEPAYTYDSSTGRWNTDKWQYNNETGTYEAKPAPVPLAPEQVAPLSPTPSNDPSTSTTNTSGNTSNTGVNIQNNNTSTAQTGTANVTGNTSAGNATSGNAAASTTVVNTIHSTVGGDTVGIAHFTSDIYGNVTGDITLSAAIDSLSSPAADQTLVTNNSVALTNNVSVDAASGDANVARNTSAGNATTGSANAVANVINLINSIIAANKSFVGTINIYGNLNGDILVSPDFIPQLIASNAQGGSTSLQSNDTQSIVNNVNLEATSGSAQVTKNTTAGQATTGTAATNLTILNLSGHQVEASNSLLVFVNVLGSWVGIIVDAPAGTTAAALGSGVTNKTGGANTQMTSNNDSQITNNINVSASSGDAKVTQNTSAGNASTGNATASANILNINMSNFSLSDWFGILFINVYGSWDGSFGVDTASGNIPTTSTPTAANTGQVTPPFSFGFTPHSNTSDQKHLAVAGSSQTDDSGTAVPEEVLGAATTADPIAQKELTKAAQAEVRSNPLFVLLVTILLIGLAGAAATTLARRRKLA